MQNAPTMLGQKMMNRQAPYGPIGMVSQNMSGNKKKSVVAIPKLFFNVPSSGSGLTFTNSNATVVNNTAATYKSAKALSLIPIGATFVYFEFIVGNTNQQRLGLALSTFDANHVDSNLFIVGAGFIGNTFSYSVPAGVLTVNGTFQATYTAVTTNDVVGFQIEMTASTFFITIRVNGTVVANRLNYSATFTQGNTVAWVPAWSSAVTPGATSSIANQTYSYPGYTPVGAF